MSWEGYIEHLMVPLASGKLKSAAIVGQDGGMWAQSGEFPGITEEQVAAIMGGFDSLAEKGHAGDLGAKGIFMGPTSEPPSEPIKFQVVPSDETVIRGKTTDGGCCIKKTNTALVIGIYESPTQAGDVNVLVENLGEYLAQQQY